MCKHDYSLMIILCGQLTGFKQESIFVNKTRKSKTNYTLFKKLHILLQSIINYSGRPLYLLFFGGLLISLISFLIILFLVIMYFFNPTTVPGWLSLLCLSWFGIGLSILSNGIIAIYVKSIFIEVKRRPSTIIRRKYK